jgi:hypothetical protein
MSYIGSNEVILETAWQIKGNVKKRKLHKKQILKEEKSTYTKYGIRRNDS